MQHHHLPKDQPEPIPLSKPHEANHYAISIGALLTLILIVWTTIYAQRVTSLRALAWLTVLLSATIVSLTITVMLLRDFLGRRGIHHDHTHIAAELARTREAISELTTAIGELRALDEQVAIRLARLSRRLDWIGYGTAASDEDADDSGSGDVVHIHPQRKGR